MSDAMLNRRLWLAALPALGLAACATEAPPEPVATTPAPPPAPPAEQPLGNAVGRVEMNNWQVGFIGQVAWGSGTLIYQGRTHRFRVRGLGAGGVGMARVRAVGRVYNMTSIEQFPGIYGQARAGLVAPGAQMRGGLWLQNTSGVRLNLIPNRTGLAAQVGADGILIEMM
ncbi:hypothetical protein KTR66_09345 [Roseococcus sp. SDR]|uniref:hypothetical protein n=1 Tax=Roseococcus sp. SDR TaxID=2835532 RepID=UPI001BCDF9E7|nr:hypothetical protein [Roseococcus sp. SDR]MBS7790200.1 hypothetical protein [Roseococcus sp. SDR]MBV1845514.1 hypothetical protein [Roseococcus sp. SDR]